MKIKLILAKAFVCLSLSAAGIFILRSFFLMCRDFGWAGCLAMFGSFSLCFIFVYCIVNALIFIGGNDKDNKQVDKSNLNL